MTAVHTASTLGSVGLPLRGGQEKVCFHDSLSGLPEDVPVKLPAWRISIRVQQSRSDTSADPNSA